MTKSGRKQESKEVQLWCECERCHSLQCHMPKWKDVKAKPPKRGR
jgi:hypothetical protein